MVLGVGHILTRLFVLITTALLLIYKTLLCSGLDMITIYLQELKLKFSFYS